MTNHPFRFSLRSLILAVLLIASAGTLWSNWKIWTHAYQLNLPQIERVEFTPNFRFIENSHCGSGDDSVTYFDARNGRRVLTLTHPTMRNTVRGTTYASSFFTSEGGNYTLWHGPSGALKPKEIWRIDTGEKLDVTKWTSDPDVSIRFSPHDRFLLLSTKSQLSLINLSTRRVVTRIARENEKWGVVLSPDDEFLFLNDYAKKTVTRIATATGLVQNEWNMPPDPESDLSYFFPDGSKFACRRIVTNSNHQTLLCDASSGRILAEIPGDFKRFCGNYVITNSPMEIWQIEPSPRCCLKIDKIPYLCAQMAFVHQDKLHYFKRQTGGWNIEERFEDPVWIDLKTGQTVNTLDPEFSFTANKNFALRIHRNENALGSPTAILDADSCEVLIDFSSPRWKDFAVENWWDIHFAENQPLFFTCTRNWKENTSRIDAWRQNHPHYWYGPAYLPEFWFTAIFTVALLWSIIRDRKTL